MSRMDQIFKEAITTGDIRATRKNGRDFYSLVDVARFYLKDDKADAAVINSVFDHFRKENSGSVDGKHRFEATTNKSPGDLRSIQGTYVGRFRDFVLIDYPVSLAAQQEKASRRIAPEVELIQLPALITDKSIPEGFPVVLTFGAFSKKACDQEEVDVITKMVADRYREILTKFRVMEEENADLKRSNELLSISLEQARSADFGDLLATAFDVEIAENRLGVAA